MNKRPFKIHAESQVSHVKQWLIGQVTHSRLHVNLSRIEMIQTPEDAVRFIEAELDKDARVRLQKALSVRRQRKAKVSERCGPDKRHVKTEITQHARETLAAVAASRNMTTSELIIETFSAEYHRLDN